MFFKEAINHLITRFPDSLSVSNTSSNDIAKNALNLAISEVYRAAHWNFRKATGQITLIPNYTTGSATITQYDGTNESSAKLVTFSGASLTQSMVGRYFRKANGTNWYKIVYVSGNSIYLETPVIEASGTYSFEIWKRFYSAESEADIILNFYLYESSRNLNFAGNSPVNFSYNGQPFQFTPYGIDSFDDVEYTTGTISGSENSNVVTGVGTSFLSNVSRGDVLINGDVEYIVKRIETDTRIILKNYLKSEISSGSNYRILKNNPPAFQFYYNADSYLVVSYDYLKKPYRLVNEDYDPIPFDDAYMTAMFSRAEMMIRKDKDSLQWQAVSSLYAAELNGLKQKRQLVEPSYMQFAPANLEVMPGRG